MAGEQLGQLNQAPSPATRSMAAPPHSATSAAPPSPESCQSHHRSTPPCWACRVAPWRQQGAGNGAGGPGRDGAPKAGLRPEWPLSRLPGDERCLHSFSAGCLQASLTVNPLLKDSGWDSAGDDCPVIGLCSQFPVCWLEPEVGSVRRRVWAARWHRRSGHAWPHLAWDRVADGPPDPPGGPALSPRFSRRAPHLRGETGGALSS